MLRELSWAAPADFVDGLSPKQLALILLVVFIIVALLWSLHFMCVFGHC